MQKIQKLCKESRTMQIIRQTPIKKLEHTNTTLFVSLISISKKQKMDSDPQIYLCADSFMPNKDWSNVLQITDGPFPEPDEVTKRRLYRFKLHQSRYGRPENFGVPKYKLWESYKFFILNKSNTLFQHIPFVNGKLHDIEGQIFFHNGTNMYVTSKVDPQPINTDLRWLLADESLILIYAPHELFPLKQWEETSPRFPFSSRSGSVTLSEFPHLSPPTFESSDSESDNNMSRDP